MGTCILRSGGMRCEQCYLNRQSVGITAKARSAVVPIIEHYRPYRRRGFTCQNIPSEGRNLTRLTMTRLSPVSSGLDERKALGDLIRFAGPLASDARENQANLGWMETTDEHAIACQTGLAIYSHCR
jgi:hypothetical protein